MAKIEAKLKELGLELPAVSAPIGNFAHAQRLGDLLYLSGIGPLKDGKPTITGKLGAGLTLDQGYAAAQQAVLNLLAVVKDELGDLDKVKQIVKLLGMVNSDPSFDKQPAVINGASDLLVKLFGDKGRHARSSVGMAALPMGFPVAIEMIVQIEE